MKSLIDTRKKNQVTTIPTLKQLAIYTLIDNVDALGDVGDVPSYLLEQVFAVCSPEQLNHIETSTRRDDLNTEKYWESHCKKVGIKEKAPNATWKDMWLQKVESDRERERRALKRLREMHESEQAAKRAKQIKILPSQPLRPPKKSRQSQPTPREIIKKKLAQKIW
jgi:transcription elongation factor B polypeptide 3